MTMADAAPFGSAYRMRLLTAVQQRVIREDDQRIDPPLTDDERRWIGLGPRKLLAEIFVPCGSAPLPKGHPDHRCSTCRS